MILQLCEQQPAIAAVHLECSPLEWQILEDVAEFLQPFKVATEYLSGEKYPMISVLGPLLAEILAKVEFTEDDTPTLREVKKVLATDMHIRYQDRRVTEALHISSFLDPRFKMLAILTKDVQEKPWDSLKEEMLEHPEVITRRTQLKLNPQNAKKPHPPQKLLETKFKILVLQVVSLLWQRIMKSSVLKLAVIR